MSQWDNLFIDKSLLIGLQLNQQPNIKQLLCQLSDQNQNKQ